MKQDQQVIYKGLEGIYVDTTAISQIDGELGLLSYRGIPIEELVGLDFATVCFLVLFGRRPCVNEREELETFLLGNSHTTKKEEAILGSIPEGLHPMKVLQGMIPLIDLENENNLKGAYSEELRNGLMVAAKLPAILAAFHRIRIGEKVLSIKKGLSFNANFLYRFTGKLPTDLETKTLDTAQILQMEHGFNASTYSARVTASTLAPVEVALSAAIGTLYGKLHGRADQAALEMAMEIGRVEDVENFILSALDSKKKIMGMGHRVYKVVDPRAKILRPMAEALCAGTPFEGNFRVLEKIEEVMGTEMLKKGKHIKANVEFYKGPVFYALGIPTQYFTSLFAMSRTFGYLAHILESRKDNKLIRPKAFYVGN
ncbi:MAG: citrate synthase [Bacteriovoracaceae bacterium]|nr:citrate synthase [Bacteriovoracaceae bacterium]